MPRPNSTPANRTHRGLEHEPGTIRRTHTRTPPAHPNRPPKEASLELRSPPSHVLRRTPDRAPTLKDRALILVLRTQPAPWHVRHWGQIPVCCDVPCG